MATKTGTPNNDLLIGTSSADTLYGLAGNDTLEGKGGADTLDGGAGVDSMKGGAGNDTYIVDDANDVVVEVSGEGTDTVQSSVSYTLSANVEKLTLLGNAISAIGNSLANTLTGNNTDNILDGGAGADTMKGGLGNDTYYVDNTGDSVTESSGQGTDTVVSSFNYTLGSNLENLSLIGTATTAIGNTLNNSLIGNALNNTLDAKGGDDTLDGGAGADSMIGGSGNDTYFVDNSGDRITESSNGGIDTVNSSINYTLSNNLEHLTLIGSAVGGTGNSGANILKGNNAENVLDGKAGADTMSGGMGGDSYYVDNIGDVVSEVSGQGYDSVFSSVNHTLANNVEVLYLLDGALKGTGNALDNFIEDNAGNNTLSGLDGKDIVEIRGGMDTAYGGQGEDTLMVDYSASTAPVQYVETFDPNTYFLAGGNGSVYAEGFEHFDIRGGSGNDTLGSKGDDTLNGGMGDDTYLADAYDTIVESVGGGIDTVITSGDYTLVGEVENLQLEGSAKIGIGSYTDNQIYGNANDNILDGREGFNSLYAEEGNDTVISGRGWDWADGGDGTDTLRIELEHDMGSNHISAYGYDEGNGSHHYSVNISGSTLNSNVGGSNFEYLEIIGSSGSDTILGSGFGEYIEGGAGNDLIQSYDGDDTLVGGSHHDTLEGGLGHDIAVADFSNASFAYGGVNVTVNSNTYYGPWEPVIQAYVNDQFGNSVDIYQVEELRILGGVGNDTISGGIAGEMIDGGAGFNTLFGGDGNDTVIAGQGEDFADGGNGDDTLRFDLSHASGNLNIDLNASINWDSSVHYLGNANNYSNGSFLAHVNANGFEHFEVTGGSGNDTINGSVANETINGGAGNDSINGGEGNDTVIAGQGMDTVSGGWNFNEENTLIADFSASDQNRQINSTLQSFTTPWGGTEIWGNINDQFGNNIQIDGGFDQVQILSGAGDDTINGSMAAELINGGAGFNTSFGGGGNDTVIAGQGGDFADGGNGDDTLRFDLSHASGNLNINLNANTNWDGSLQFWGIANNYSNGNFPANVNAYSFEHFEVTGGSGNDTINGSIADETLDGGKGNDSIFGGEGNDTIIAGQGMDTVSGGWNFDENNTLIADFGASTQDVQITSNLQSFTTPWGATEIYGNINDQLGNNIQIDGGFDEVEILGGVGNDTISGGIAGELIDGGAGFNTLFSGDGNDTVIAGQGGDFADGGNGDDTLRFDLSHVSGNLNINLHANTNWDGTSQFWGDANNYSNGGFFAHVNANGFEHFEVIGGSGNDTINGSIADETLDGGKGNDSIFGGEGNDTIIAGQGMDTVSGGWDLDENNTLIADFSQSMQNLQITSNLQSFTTPWGATEIYGNINDQLGNNIQIDGGFDEVEILGGVGNDTISGGIAGELIDGGAGFNTLFSGDGNDTVIAGQGGDFADGGNGDDTLRFDLSHVSGNLNINLHANTNWDGTSQFWGDANNYSNGGFFAHVNANGFEHFEVIGGSGNDTINGSIADETLDGGKGNDSIFGGEGNDTIIAGQGMDTVSGGWDLDENNTLIADFSQSMQNLQITSNLQSFATPWGATEIYGNINDQLGNNIQIDGGFDQVQILSGAGDDTINGGMASELINAGAGFNTSFGGGGNDTVIAGQGSDFADGGNGDDTLRFDLSHASGNLNINLHANTNWDATSQFWGDANNYSNGSFLAHINAYGFEHFEITGGSGNDTINGSVANETINGGAGNDSINGGNGIDTLAGGAGQDYFIYASPAEVSNGEWITDFDLGWDGDFLDLRGLGTFADAQHLQFRHIDSNSDGLTDYTSVAIDLNGGGNSFTHLVNLQGVEMTLGNWENLLV